MRSHSTVKYCELCLNRTAYLISVFIDACFAESLVVFCKPCLRDVLDGRYHHIQSASFWVVVGPYRREVIPRQSEAA